MTFKGLVNPNHQAISHQLFTGSGQGSSIHEKSSIQTARIGIGTCSKDDVVIYQVAMAALPNGIPTYTVQIRSVKPPLLLR
jgi:hypothetical protein